MAHRIPKERAPLYGPEPGAAGYVPVTDADGKMTLWGGAPGDVTIPICADGGLLVADGGAYVCLAIGDEGQVLGVGASGLEYVDLPASPVAGVEALAEDDVTLQVTFAVAMADTDYVVAGSLSNIVDLVPTTYSWVVTEKTTTDFTVRFSGSIASDNYTFEWVATPY